MKKVRLLSRPSDERCRNVPTPQELAQKLRFVVLGSNNTEQESVVLQEKDYSDQKRNQGRGEVEEKTVRKSTITWLHVAVVVCLLFAALGLTLVQLTRSRAHSIPLTRPSVTFTPASRAPSSPVLWRVHVMGAVNKPGVVSIQQEARVLDAVEAAGGFTSSARPGELNLAARVIDGCQIIVGDAQTASSVRVAEENSESSGSAEVGTGNAAEGAKNGKIDLNTASATQLDALPGVGPVTAQKILDRRNKKRFTRVEELREVDGIGPKTYAQIAAHVRV